LKICQQSIYFPSQKINVIKIKNSVIGFLIQNPLFKKYPEIRIKIILKVDDLRGRNREYFGSMLKIEFSLFHLFV